MAKKKPSPAVKAAADRAEARSAGKPIEEPKVAVDPIIGDAKTPGLPKAAKKELDKIAKGEKRKYEMKRRIVYTPEMADRLCEWVAGGQSLRSFCRQDDTPGLTTVFKWLDEHPDFAKHYARACDARIDAHIDDTVDIADDPELKADDKRVRIATRQWNAERMRPKKYGSLVKQELTGADGGPIDVRDGSMTEVARRMAFIMAAGIENQRRAIAAKQIEAEATQVEGV